tara:strand:- start:644 stop:2353 length:1710 start_codon:yes stop_codon:yes gene_type:complete
MLKKTLEILPKKSRKRFYKTLVLSFCASTLELLSLSLIVPIIYFIVNPENKLLVQIVSFIKVNFNKTSTEEIYNLLIIALIVIFLLKTFYLSFFIRYQLIFKRNLRSALASELFAKYLKLQYVKAIKLGFAEMQKNIDNETHRYSELVLSYVIMFNEIIMSISIVTFLFLFNFEISLAVLGIFFSIFIVFIFIFKNRFKNWGIKSQEAYGNYHNTLLQSFNNLREIKLQGKEDFFIYNFSIDNKLKNYFQINQRIYSSLPRYFIELVAILLIFSILFIMLKNNYELDHILATLGVFAYACIRLLPMLNKLIHVIGEIRFLSYATNVISDQISFLNTEPSLNARKNYKITDIDTIELEEINFSYKRTVLDKLSLTLKKGNITGLYGSSGAGKTTLLDILSSLIIPDNGKILINKKHIDPKSFFWGNSVGYISQSSDLFNDTIKKNIAFGELEKNIDDEKINYSLKASNLNKFIKELPDGLDTIVGEKGSQISSGQKQRVNIARAFYNDTKILIMDEATNAIDSENEENIFNDIIKIKENLIVLVVSHDKKLLNKVCDNIFVLENHNLRKI